MSNVLVIHPTDRSTEYLKRVYKDKGYDVFIQHGPDRSIVKAIQSHDRIIILGNGTQMGLVNPNWRDVRNGYLINVGHRKLLNEKEVVSIWNKSDDFFRKIGQSDNQLHTGQFITDLTDQMLILGDDPLTELELAENRERFADILHDCIEMNGPEMKEYILEHYTGDDPVTKYNRDNLIVL